MKTRICDICGQNMSEVSYKIKSKEEYEDTFFHRVDMCPNCYMNMIKYIQEKKSLVKNMIKEEM